MLLVLFATLGLLGRADHALAQGQSQNCAFALISDDVMLGQLPGGQVLGIPTTHNTSAEVGGILFRLQEGQLYDSHFRACWWVAPTTVLVCNLSPQTLPEPLFSIDEETRLVYNSSQSNFWECPVDLGSEAGMQGSMSYYLDLPPDMEAGGGCRRVKVEAALFGGWFCGGEGEASSSLVGGTASTSSSSSSSTSTSTSFTALSVGEATRTVSWTELSLSGSWIAVTETVWQTVGITTTAKATATVTVETASGASATEIVS